MKLILPQYELEMRQADSFFILIHATSHLFASGLEDVIFVSTER